MAIDFFTGEAMWLQRLYVLSFVELGSRRVHVAGCTPHPSAAWVTQQARQLTWTLTAAQESIHFLIRDRDQKFAQSFDEVFQSEGVQIVRTPFRVPQGEWGRGAIRAHNPLRVSGLDADRELERHLQRVLAIFVDHYNGHRPHRALALSPPYSIRPAPAVVSDELKVHRRDRLGGVVREYVPAA